MNIPRQSLIEAFDRIGFISFKCKDIVTRHVAFVSHKGKLAMVSTDNFCGGVYFFGLDVGEDFRPFCLEGLKLYNILKLISDEVDFSLIEETCVKLTSGREVFHFPIFDWKKYPFDFDQLSSFQSVIQLDAVDLVGSLAFVRPFMDGQAIYENMRLIQYRGGAFIGGTPTRVSSSILGIPNNGFEIFFWAVDDLIRFVKSGDLKRKFELHANDKYYIAMVAGSDHQFFYKKTKYVFPSVEKMFTGETSVSVTFDRKTLLGSVKKMIIMLDGISNDFCLRKNGANVSMFADSALGKASEIVLPVQVTEGSFSVVLNGKYLYEVINSFESDKITLEFGKDFVRFVARTSSIEHRAVLSLSIKH